MSSVRFRPPAPLFGTQSHGICLRPAEQREVRLLVNLILFNPEETGRPLPLQDARAVHILKILRRQRGDTFDVGLINGPRGKATLTSIESDHLGLTFAWGETPPPADPITLIIGLPRPQTARKILQEATTLGVAALHFVTTKRGESSYAKSTLWSSGEWERHIHAGAAQAFCTQVPQVTHSHSLPEIITRLAESSPRVALDNYEGTKPLSQSIPSNVTEVTIALGAERGWSPEERTLLRDNAFTLSHLGERVLRLETAVVSAISLVKAQRGLM